jgi:hypothetical protein
VVLHEVIHEIQRSNAKSIVLKLDFEKANYKVQWPFFMHVLELEGFSEKWIDWMKLAVETGKVCINLNVRMGSTSGPSEGFGKATPCLQFCLTSLVMPWWR